ncbi:unnamed protein product [Thelazia callipaeda]|uniref:snRNA-activating protein complex subunit 3 n=1 Tax=Thelazia callipaeda TaxID=103827 RepID=A0A158RAQ1_THECL|nr:unnamed protein product [Thelazia callipaeda]
MAMDKVAQRERDKLRSAFHLEPFFYHGNPSDIFGSVHAKTLSKVQTMDDSEEAIRKLQETFDMEISSAQEVLSSLNINHLALLNKRDIFFRKKIDRDDIPNDTELETLKLKKRELDMFYPIKKKPVGQFENPRQHKLDLKIRRNVQQSIFYGTTVLKYGNYYENEMKHHRNDGYGTSMLDDIVVTIVICKPHNKNLENSEKRTASFNPYWRFLVRGETTLLELHGLFRCTGDFGTVVDVGTTPELHQFDMFRYPSSFLFIHDTFYIAQSYAASEETLSQIDWSKLEPHIDISEPVRAWMQRKSRDFGPTNVKTLNEGKVRDLICRLGYPYVYVHQGNCEHIFFFTDLRLVDARDYPFDFPHKLSDTSLENYCITCHRRIADWIVENETFPVSPAHMCNRCYRSFHFVFSYRQGFDSRAFVYVDPSLLHY